MSPRDHHQGTLTSFDIFHHAHTRYHKKPRKSMGYMYRYLIKYGGQGEKLVQSQRSRVKSSISNYLSASNVTINPLKKLSDLYVFIYLKRLGDQQNIHQM